MKSSSVDCSEVAVAGAGAVAVAGAVGCCLCHCHCCCSLPGSLRGHSGARSFIYVTVCSSVGSWFRQ